MRMKPTTAPTVAAPPSSPAHMDARHYAKKEPDVIGTISAITADESSGPDHPLWVRSIHWLAWSWLLLVIIVLWAFICLMRLIVRFVFGRSRKGGALDPGLSRMLSGHLGGPPSAHRGLTSLFAGAGLGFLLAHVMKRSRGLIQVWRLDVTERGTGVTARVPISPSYGADVRVGDVVSLWGEWSRDETFRVNRAFVHRTSKMIIPTRVSSLAVVGASVIAMALLLILFRMLI